MKRRPVILITPSSQSKGAEFEDRSISLSGRYVEAVVEAGGLPCILPLVREERLIRQSVAAADGVLLTGGDDIQPRLYRRTLSRRLARTVQTEDAARDWMELAVLRAAFRADKPVLAICRGHQLLNVALGGGLWVDIATELRGALSHQCMARKDEPVHAVRLRPGSRLARILRRKSLRVNSTHHQGVAQPALPLVASAWSADGVVEAMEPVAGAPGLPAFLISVQFHPERLMRRERVFLRLFRAFIAAAGSARSTGRPAARRRS